MDSDYSINGIVIQTEEDVKNKIVVPFLSSLGINTEELIFEKCFEITTGRSVTSIDCRDHIEKKRPRLDILLKRNGRNLLVVEVKNYTTSISEEEIAQATSYSKLTRPITPLTMITNGKDFELFDSISEEKIDKSDFKIRDEYEIKLPDEALYEALKLFIRYSEHNLLVYSKNQLKNNMQTLLGSKDEPNKKYIPELHVERKDLSDKIDKFINSDKKVFAILGDSGSGKTCSMCHLAQKMVNQGIVTLFYKSFELGDNILNTISQDINLEFSQQSDETQIVKRLSAIFSEKDIFLYIDAIDEWPVAQSNMLIDRFVSIISTQPNIKIIISCKTNTWNKYLDNNGDPTRIKENLDYIDGEFGYYLPQLTDWEFSKTLAKYRLFYNYNGKIDRGILEECKRSLFLLRIAFTIAEKNGNAPFTLFSIDIYNEYLKTILKKYGQSNEDYFYKILIAASKLAYTSDSSLINLDKLKEMVDLRPSETLPSIIFDYNVFEKNQKNIRTDIKFYYDKLRDYLIAFHVKKWNECEKKVFEDDVNTLCKGGVKEQSISFFLPFANSRLKTSFLGELYSNAEKYLNFYIKVIKTEFPQLKSYFSPYTTGDIGFITLVDISKVQFIMYGFRRLRSHDEQSIQLVPFSGPSDNIHKLDDYGAWDIHASGSANFFQEINIENEIIENEILKQIDVLISSGQLNESSNIDLLRERVLAISYGINNESMSYDRIRIYYSSIAEKPLVLSDIEASLKYIRAIKYYRSELIEERVKEGKFKRVITGTRSHTEIDLCSEDYRIIENKAEIASKNNSINIPRSGYRELEELNDMFCETKKYLNELDIKEISNYQFYDPEEISISDYLTLLYKQIFTEYKTLLETNFPTLKEYFYLYSQMPFKVFITTKKISSDYVSVDVYYCKNNEIADNIIRYSKDANPMIDWSKNKIIIDGEQHDLTSSVHSELMRIINPQEKYFNYKVSGAPLSIRGNVYSIIKREFKNVKKYLYEKYDVDG